MNLEEAKIILKEWTKNDGLILHAEAVCNSMKFFAEQYDEDIEKFMVTGLLHDMDYEKYPTEEEHPYKGVEFLKTKGVEEEILKAILGHASYTKVSRETKLAKALYAVDELSGFVTAVCYVTSPQKPKLKSVKKKLKTQNFAAKVNRDEVEDGITQLGIDRDEIIQLVIDAVWDIFPNKESL